MALLDDLFLRQSADWHRYRDRCVSVGANARAGASARGEGRHQSRHSGLSGSC